MIRSLDNSFIFIAYPGGLNSIENCVLLFETNPLHGYYGKNPYFNFPVRNQKIHGI